MPMILQTPSGPNLSRCFARAMRTVMPGTTAGSVDATILPIHHRPYRVRGRPIQGRLIDWAKEMFGYKIEVGKRGELHQFKVVPKQSYTP